MDELLQRIKRAISGLEEWDLETKSDQTQFEIEHASQLLETALQRMRGGGDDQSEEVI